jgi:hypothetical protein
MARMRIDARDADGRRLGRVELDETQRPSLVRLVDPANPDDPAKTEEPGRERYLNWEGGLDDAGHLRRCVICGCTSLYRSKALPQVTPFIVVLAFVGAIVGLLGYANHPLVLPALVVLLGVDVATLALARTRLVCYRCGSVYSRCPIARYHRRWARSEAERVHAEREPAEQQVAAPQSS